MSPQRSNREALVEGTLRCLERLPAERITARAIAEEAGANLASIAYHFGSKDELVTEAVIEGLDRWLVEIADALGDVERFAPEQRLRRAGVAFDETRMRHTGLATNFMAALARAQHDDRVREALADGFRRTRPRVAALLGFGVDQAGVDAAGLVHSIFTSLLFQELLDPSLAITGRRMTRAQARLTVALPRSS
jgi:AcrR family transcriptional regulator